MRSNTTERAARAHGGVAKAGLGLALSVAALAVTATGALFTDSETVTGNNFTSGKVSLTADRPTALVTYADNGGMVPGDTVDGQPLVITNDGTTELRYAMTTSVTGDASALASALQLTVWDEANEADENTTCSTTKPAEVTALYAGGLDTGSFGNVAQGEDVGDQVVAAADSQTLCFAVELPSTADNTVADQQANVTFQFDAEQTQNN